MRKRARAVRPRQGHSMSKYVNILLLFIPVAVVGEFLHWNPMIVFFCAALAVIPLAGRC